MSKRDLPIQLNRAELAEFWSHVKTSCGCWEWGLSLQHGYGQWRRYRAHRVAFTAVFGPIPEGAVIDHMCRNTKCVNPYHLDVVDSRQNTMRSPISQASMNIRKTHCRYGHEYTASNTRMYRGKRHCITCAQVVYYTPRGATCL